MINVLYFALVAIVSYLIGTINFSKILAGMSNEKI